MTEPPPGPAIRWYAIDEARRLATAGRAVPPETVLALCEEIERLNRLLDSDSQLDRQRPSTTEHP